MILKLKIGDIMKTIKVNDGNIELMLAFICILLELVKPMSSIIMVKLF